MAKKKDTLSEIGRDLCKSLGFNPTSNSTKPLYVANSLFRACTGMECLIDDIHDWVLSERNSKAIPSKELLDKYKSIVYISGDDVVDDIKEMRLYLEKLFNPDSTVYPSKRNSVLNISSKWMVRENTESSAGIGTFLYEILNTPINGEKSKAISVIQDALMDDDDDLSRTVKPIIVCKPEEERVRKRDLGDTACELNTTSRIIRNGFDQLAENCEAYNNKNGKNSLLTLRRMVNYAIFATFFYLEDINRTVNGGKRIPLLLDSGVGSGAIENASESCFVACKKSVEDYTIAFASKWLKESCLISDVNNETACKEYISNGFTLDDEIEAKGARNIILQHISGNCQSGDSPLLATAKAIQFAIYTYTYHNTTPSDFCNVLGSKSGFVGPNSSKYKRLLINRFLLETIVLSIVNNNDLQDGIELRELGSSLRDNYNIIIGTDTDIDYSILEEYGIAHATPEDLRGELPDNAKEIANMLISMGLAKRYADGVTLIGWEV